MEVTIDEEACARGVSFDLNCFFEDVGMGKVFTIKARLSKLLPPLPC